MGAMERGTKGCYFGGLKMMKSCAFVMYFTPSPTVVGEGRDGGVFASEIAPIPAIHAGRALRCIGKPFDKRRAGRGKESPNLRGVALSDRQSCKAKKVCCRNQ